MRIFTNGVVSVHAYPKGAVVDVMVKNVPCSGELSPEDCAAAGEALIRHAAFLHKQKTEEGGA